MVLQDALQGGGHQQILLLQPQALAANMVVGGVENLGNGLGHGVMLQGADIVAPGEGRHIEATGLLRAPQGQLVDLVGAVAGDKQVMGNRHNRAVVHMGHPELAVVVPLPGFAAQAHLHGVIFPGLEPHVAHIEPVVGELHLPAVHDLLAENAELIADGKARGRVFAAGEAVHIAGSQAAQTAVAQTRVGLQGAKALHAEAQAFQHRRNRIQHTHVIQVVSQGGSHQELHGHIIDLLAFLFPDLLLERAALLRQLLPDIGADRLVGLLLRGLFQAAAKGAAADLLQSRQNLCFVFSLVHMTSEWGLFHGRSRAASIIRNMINHNIFSHRNASVPSQKTMVLPPTFFIFCLDKIRSIVYDNRAV